MDNNKRYIMDCLIKAFSKYNIEYKENANNIIVLCPNCLLRDNKYKVKLYIDKYNYIFHCFRCGIKGSPRKLYDTLALFNDIPKYHGIIDELKKIRILLTVSIPSIINNYEKIYEFDTDTIVKLSSTINSITNETNKFLGNNVMYNNILYLPMRGIDIIPQDNKVFKVINPDFHNEKNNKKISLYPSIGFRSYFDSDLVFRYTNTKNKLRYYNIRTINKFATNIFNEYYIRIPDYYLIQYTNNMDCKHMDIILLEGCIDALSFYNMIKDDTMSSYHTKTLKRYLSSIQDKELLIGSLSGKNKVSQIFEFIYLIQKIRYKHLRRCNVYIIMDNDVNNGTIKQLNKTLLKEYKLFKEHSSLLVNFSIINVSKSLNMFFNVDSSRLANKIGSKINDYNDIIRAIKM